MNYKTIEMACNKVENLLNRESLHEQQAIMKQAEFDLINRYLLDQIRTDDPMAFCLDLEQALKNQDPDNLPMVDSQSIRLQTEPLELIIMLIP